ncbi:neuraminidase-like domain-containing protein [Lysobacter hankyongensis]|uniref:Carboxypeptidase regulatory-like domain-containing protein n=1 Tax=Lysobacter hankyongensis TaxID=1176535 RepID=A0ABP9C2U1_9GAMM
MTASITLMSSIDHADATRIAALQQALIALGFAIDAQERSSGKAGRGTLLAVRAIERGAGLDIDDRVLLSAGAAAEINRRLALAGLVAGPADGPSETLLVEGRVLGSDGVPIGGLGVEVFDQDLRSRQSLGSATTDPSGRYAVAYQAGQFLRAEKGYADIVVQVSGANGEKPLYESEVRFNAPPHLVHDVRLDLRGPSLYDRLLAAIEPLAAAQKVALEELDENDRFRDVRFLAGETGFEATPIAALAVAARLSRDSGLDRAMLFAAILSGIWPEPAVDQGRELRDLDARAASLRRRFGEPSRDALRDALATAVARGIVDADAPRIERFVEAFADFAGRDGTEGNHTDRPGQALSPALLRELLGPQAKDLDRHLDAGTGVRLVARLKQDPDIPVALRRRVEALVALDDATLGDRDLVGGLAGDIATPEQVGVLARHDAKAWTGLLKKAGKREPPAYVAAAGGDMARYGELLAARFRSRFPTQAFLGDLARDRKSPKPLQALAALVDADPAIDFASLSLDRYAARAKKRAPERKQLLKTVEALKPVQRLYKVASDYAAVKTLSKHGLGSAQAVYRRGQDAVVDILTREAGMSARAATLAYERAAATSAASLQLAVGLAAEAEVSGMPVMAALSAADTSALPELGALFNLGNDCACTDCSSVLSPAAYLADLMLFLSNRDVGGGRDARDVLLSRRPDLDWIDLNCANAFTPLPYIDLAIEAMEDLVAAFAVGTLTAAERATLPADSDDHPVPAAAVAAFAGFVPPIALGAAARVRKAGTSWVLRDGDRSVRITATGEARVLRNTHGTPAERALMPEYTSPPAVAALAGKSFPWTLPLDLAGAETRLSLSKLGIERDALMRELRGPAAPNNGTDFELAAARLGIGPALATLLVTPAANPGPHWGTTTAAQAVARCTPVPAFLAATGLSYADLLRLLALPYANPAGALSIQHLDDSCDLAQKRIVTLDAGHLDRLHRFLRLARALGASTADADLLVRRFGAGGNLATPADLVAIADATRVRALLGDLPVDELVALFGPIPTDDRFDALHEPLLPSLYRRLFLDPLVHRPVDPAFAVSAVTAVAPAALIAQHRPAIVAALQIASTDLDALLPLAGPALSLANLSLLYRHVRVARALELPLAEWLAVARLAGGNPFASPADLIRTLDLVARSRTLELDAAALMHLLEARLDVSGALAADAAAESLAALRAAQQAIDVDTALPAADSDRQSLIERLDGALAPLDPDASRAARIAEVVENRFVARVEISPVPAQARVFTAAVAALPFTAVVDGARLVLSYTGVMGPAAKALLTSAAEVGPVAGNAAWAPAIDALAQQPRLHIATVSTRYEAPLSAWPAGLALPVALKRRVRPLATRNRVQFDGIMTADERAALNAASADPAWIAAVTALYDQPRADPVPAAERLADFATWQFAAAADDEAAADAKIRANLLALLGVLLPRARAAASEDAAIAAIATLTELDRESSQRLLRRVVIAGGSPLALLTDRAGFVDTSGPVAPAALAPQFQAVDLIHRAARIAATFRMGAREIDLTLTLAAAANSDLLSFAALPLAYAAPPPAPPGPPALSPLARLVRLGELLLLDRRTARKPVRLLELMARVLADAASVSLGPVAGKLDLFATADTALAWSASDVAALAAPGAGLGLAYPQDFRNAQAWLRLSGALTLIRRTRLAAADALKLARATPTGDDAAIARQAMRARLGTQFDEAGRQVQDALRTLRRDALCDYILTYVEPGTGGLPASPTGGWRKPTDVFAYLLIDPKMGACQMTSRIVQATIAIQTFVDRCFMGFEPDVSPHMAADGRWDQWKWMKAYRLWEANRKVFLFPENWVEPELRRDKSYAFKDLEDELLQSELTEDSARDAFLNYIDKLDQVANLDVTGVHWQDGDGYGRGAFHVVGRTAGQEPHAYFYRRFDHPSERWTPWSKIEIDLKSAPVVPFMYDRRTFLVWPEFREQKPETGSTIAIPASGGGGATVPVARQLIATGVALSELRNGKWTPRKVATELMPAADRPGLQEALAWMPIDLRRTAPDGRVYFQDMDARHYASTGDVYEFLGCRGYPERASRYLHIQTVGFQNMGLQAARDVEIDNVDQLIAYGTSTYLGGTSILDRTPDRVKITFPHHFNSFDLNYLQSLRTLSALLGTPSPAHGKDRYSLTAGTRAPWIFADKGQSFFVEPVSAFDDGRIFTGSEILDLWREWMGEVPPILQPLVQMFLEYALWVDPTRRLRFSMFYHPRVCSFRNALLEGGVGQLLARPTQFGRGALDFDTRYGPVDGVVLRDDADGVPVYHPVEDVDFSPRGAYSQYNWELFYHAPFLVGTQLMKAGRHEEAMSWFRHIFDPAGADGKDPVTGLPLAANDTRRFWITRPFFEREATGYTAQRIDKILRLLAADPSDPGVDVAARDELIRQVATWRDNPFDPHLVAATRDIAYQKAAFIRFVENLVAWGDKLFARPDVESVMAGGALYLYAKSFVGDMPERVPPRAKPRTRTYAELEQDIDAFGNALVAIEDLLPVLPPVGPPQTGPALPSVLHFCIPRNEKLLALWELVDDRVRKYQSCLDLLGQPRRTSLFAPPIDPAAAIAAMMAGAGAGDSLSDLAATLPPHRFQVYLQKANELAGDLKGFAGALLSALEKKDGEALAQLRQTHELKQLDAVRAIKSAAIADAETAVANLEIAREMARLRNEYYRSREFMNTGEKVALGLNTAALVISAGAAVADTLGGVLAAIPNFNAGASGFGGSPHVAVSTGGMSFSRALELAAKALTQAAGIVDKTAGMVSTVAGYQRRYEDWQMQAGTTAKEIEQYGVQIAGARIRVDNARRELANHDLQFENSKAIDEFMRSKYTNRELYAWMAGEIGKTFFESYKLAYAHAKLAERCYRFEHGLTTSSLIGFGAWDSARKGLQSGERLQLDLRRLDAAYLAANKRKFELTKHVSLAVSAPLALIELRRTGRCELDLGEELFDLDFPGHYFRLIKSAAISIPCVAGANTTIACTLRLLDNAIRVDTRLPGGAAGYPRRMQADGTPLDDPRFRVEQVPVSAIATSSGQNDSGMFELALKDDRFLPFEGAGAISRWSIELVEDETLRAFDYDSIADVILHLRYTAREEGGAFKAASVAHLRNQLVAAQSRLEMRRVFRVSSDFASSWAAFRNPAPGAVPELLLHLDRSRFPGGDERLVKLRNVQLMAEYPPAAGGAGPDFEVEFGAPPLAAAATSALALDPDDPLSRYGDSAAVGFGPTVLGATGTDWRLRFREVGGDFADFDPDALEDAYLIVGYTVQPAAP